MTTPEFLASADILWDPIVRLDQHSVQGSFLRIAQHGAAPTLDPYDVSEKLALTVAALRTASPTVTDPIFVPVSPGCPPHISLYLPLMGDVLCDIEDPSQVTSDVLDTLLGMNEMSWCVGYHDDLLDLPMEARDQIRFVRLRPDITRSDEALKNALDLLAVDGWAPIACGVGPEDDISRLLRLGVLFGEGPALAPSRPVYEAPGEGS